MRKIIHRMKRNAGTITAVLAIAGVCYTAYRGIKDGMKLNDAIKTDETFENKTTSEKVTTVLSNCYPTIISAVVTSALILTSDQKHRRVEAGLAGVAASAIHGLNGINESNIKQDIPDITKNEYGEKVTFYEPFSKQFFESTFADVFDAEYELNRLFILRGDVTMDDFLTMLGISQSKNADQFGWGYYIGEVKYGYKWIDFVHRKKEENGKTYYEINYPFQPSEDYLGDDEDDIY